MKLWGGRFEGELDPRIARFTHSLPFDNRLARHDIEGSIAHCRMLGRQRIITDEEAARIIEGLEVVRREVGEGRADFTGQEDIHSWVEARLREQAGAVAGKLHTARSRNDQVATDLRLYLREESDLIDSGIRALQRALIVQAEAHPAAILPGLTHLQHAQPVLLAHHLLAYFWMLERDRGRLRDWRARANRLPLGAGALAGSPYPVDREYVAELLGFDGPTENSLDSVADRDFVIELAAALALLGVHLSRLCEELALWAGREFGYLKLADSVSTGSSIMPQKKNPDVAELARGKTGRVTGNLVSLIVAMKGLPLAYNSDMQEDKEAIFDSVDTARSCLEAVAILVEEARFQPDRMLAATHGDFSTATDLADFLAQRGVPFREAHEVVGRIVKECEAGARTLEVLTADDLIAFHPEFASAPADITSVRSSAHSRATEGGTAPERVAEQVVLAKAHLGAE